MSIDRRADRNREKRRPQKPSRYEDTGISGAAAGFGLSSRMAASRSSATDEGLAGQTYVQQKESVSEDKGLSADKDVESDSQALIVIKQCCLVTEDGAAVADSDEAVRSNHSTKILLAEAEKICGPMNHENTLGYDSDEEDGGELEESMSTYTYGKNDSGDGSSNSNVTGERVEGGEDMEYSSYIDKSDGPNKPRSDGVMYVRKTPNKSKPYELWAQLHLRMACKNRGIANMSKCSDKGRMSGLLRALDKQKNRKTPYTEDFELENGRDASPLYGGSVTSSDDSAPYDAVPEAVRLKVQGALDLGATLLSDRTIKYNGRSYSVGDVLASIDTGIAPKPRGGKLNPSGRFSDVRGSPVHHKDEATAALKASAPRGSVKKGNGKGKDQVDLQRGGGRGRRGGRGKGKARHSSGSQATTASNRSCHSYEDPGASTKTKHCAPRFITLIVNKYRDSFMALAETKPSRGALDSGAVRSQNKIWQDICNDFINPNVDIGGRLSEDVRFVDIDPGFVGQPNVEPDKLRKMWKKVCSKWSNVKASCRSGDTEQLIDKCEENDRDTQYLVVALEHQPHLLEYCRAELPDGQGREENGVEGPRPGGATRDARRRKEASVKGRERAEKHGAPRKKQRSEEEMKRNAKMVAQETCSVLGPALAQILSPPTKEGSELEHSSSVTEKKYHENIARSEDKSSKLKLIQDHKEALNFFMKQYSEKAAELADAKRDGTDPFAIQILERFVERTSKKLADLMEEEY